MQSMTELLDTLELGRVYYTISKMSNKVKHSAQILLKNSVFLSENIEDQIALYCQETQVQAQTEKV